MVPIEWPCQNSTFFTPEPDICPSDEPETLQAAFQPFERGFMVWINSPYTIQPNIYVFTDWHEVDIHPDTWLEGEPESDPALTPPEGLLQPIRGFGNVWRQLDSHMNIGWATAPEQSFTLTRQSSFQESSISHEYLTLPDGRVIHLSGFDWQFLSP